MYRCLRGAPDGASHHICHRASTHAHVLLQRPKRVIYNDACLFVLRTKTFMSAYSPSTARRPHDATKHAKYDPPHNKTRIVSHRISRNTYRAQPLSCPQRTLRKVRAIPILVPQMQHYSNPQRRADCTIALRRPLSAQYCSKSLTSPHACANIFKHL